LILLAGVRRIGSWRKRWGRRPARGWLASLPPQSTGRSRRGRQLQRRSWSKSRRHLHGQTQHISNELRNRNESPMQRTTPPVNTRSSAAVTPTRRLLLPAAFAIAARSLPPPATRPLRELLPWSLARSVAVTSGERLDDSMFDGVLHIRGRRLPPFAERDTEEARVARGRAGSGAEGGGARLPPTDLLWTAAPGVEIHSGTVEWSRGKLERWIPSVSVSFVRKWI
jgi:hypothetical protein